MKEVLVIKGKLKQDFYFINHLKAVKEKKGVLYIFSSFVHFIELSLLLQREENNSCGLLRL